MPADTLTDRQLSRATLARQLLLAREPVTPVEAVGRLCGMQAQEARPPFVGLWTRLDGFTHDDLHAALHARDIVRATLFRGTLHLTTARDYAPPSRRSWPRASACSVTGSMASTPTRCCRSRASSWSRGR